MKISVRILVFVLALTMLSCGALSLFASSTENEAPNATVSDIFWSYDTEYLYSDLLENYSDETFAVCDEVYTYYIDNLSILSNLKDSIYKAVDPYEWVTFMIKTNIISPNLTYDNAMDQANIELAKHLMDERMLNDELSVEEVSDQIGSFLSWAEKRIPTPEEKKDLNLLGKFVESFFEDFANAFTNRSLFYYASKEMGANLADQLRKGSSSLNIISDTLGVCKALGVGILIEKCRVEIIDDILDTIPSYTYLYKGLSKLKSSIGQSAFKYLSTNYMSDFMLKKITEAVIKVPDIYTAVSGVVKIASWVVFDCLFNIPSTDEVVTQYFLTQYSKDMYYYLNEKIKVFKGQFTLQDIKNFSVSFNAYVGVTKAALEASKDLTSIDSKIESIQNNYTLMSFDYYIKNICDVINAIPQAERKLQDHGDWIINSSIKLAYSTGMPYNSIESSFEEDTLYLLNGKFTGNLILKGSSANLSNLNDYYLTVNGELRLEDGATINVPKDHHLNLNGNCSISYSKMTIEKDANLTINGNLNIISGTLDILYYAKLLVKGNTTTNRNSTLTNYGEFVCNGDFISSYSYGYAGKFVQDHDVAKFTVNGNLSFASLSDSQITGGSVVFDGDEQQTVTNLNACDVRILNFEGIKYLSDNHIHGYYALLGNPIDNNGYSTVIYDSTVFGSPDQDYKKLLINTAVTMPSILPGNVHLSGTDAILTVSGDTEHVIAGSLTLDSNSILNVTANDILNISEDSVLNYNSKFNIAKDATVKVFGELALTYSSKLTNEGTLICYDNIASRYYYGYSGTYIQHTESARLIAKKSINFSSTKDSDITAGVVVFDGSDVQSVQNLKAYNIVVNNPASLNYLSNIHLYGKFQLNGNEINNNSYATYMYDGATFADNSDYKRISITGEVLLRSNLPGQLIIDQSGALLTVPCDTEYYVADTSTIRYSKLIVSEGALLRFKSDVYLSYCGEIFNNGTVIFDKSFNNQYYYSTCGTITQKHPDAKIIFHDNVYIADISKSNITQGDVIFESDQIQSVSGLSVYNLTVTNSTELNLRTDIHVLGKYTIGNSNIIYNSYYVHIYTTTSFGDDSTYGRLMVSSPMTMTCNIVADVYVSGTGSMLIIPKGSSFSIDGNLYVSSYSDLNLFSRASLTISGNVEVTHQACVFVKEDANLSILGNTLLTSNGAVYNDGNCYLMGDFTSNYYSSSCGYYHQSSSKSTLTIGGNYSFPTNKSYTQVTDGKVIFDGPTQHKVSGLFANDVTVKSTMGLLYASDNYVYGHFDLMGNPIDCASYYTCISNNSTFEPRSDYKNVKVQEKVTLLCDVPANIYVIGSGELLIDSSKRIEELHVQGGKVSILDGSILTIERDCTVTNSGELQVEENAKLNAYSDITVTSNGNLENNGSVIIKGDLISRYYSSYCGYISQRNNNAVIHIFGNINISSTNYCNITAGTVSLCGNEVQKINGLKSHHLTVLNEMGITYLSDVYVGGRFKLNGRMLNHGSYKTVISNNTVLYSDSNYGNIGISTVTTLKTNIYGNLIITGTNPNMYVSDGDHYNVYGSCSVNNGKIFIDEQSALTVHGELTILGSSSVINYGTLECTNGINAYKSSSYGYYTQMTEKAALISGGNVFFASNAYCRILEGSVILNGTSAQYVRYMNAPIIIIENDSTDGIIFESAIEPYILFDHKGKNYTLYSNGAESFFNDYDGDGIKDDLDIHPTTTSDKCICDEVVLVFPTCIENGLLGHKCRLCSRIVEIEQIAPTGHNMGDIDNDGVISNSDISILVRYLAGWDIEICEICCDIDKNGILNNRDVILAIKKIA